MDGTEKPFTANAITKEVSKTGAQIAGVQHYFKPGQTIGFSVGGKKYRCTVMWVGRHDTPLVGHIGVQVQGHITPDWGISMPQQVVDSFNPKRIHESKKDSDSVSYFEYRSERRDAKRQPIRAGARIKPALGGTAGWGMCTDVSLGGCFIESASNVPAGTRVELTINIESAEELDVLARVAATVSASSSRNSPTRPRSTSRPLPVSARNSCSRSRRPPIPTKIEWGPTFSRKRKVGIRGHRS